MKIEINILIIIAVAILFVIQTCESFTKGSSIIKQNMLNTVLLQMSSKDSDRARFERKFEEMMGDDWRLFRAKLVAQEQENEFTRETSSLSFGDKEEVKKQIGFVGAISSMFSSSSPKTTNEEESHVKMSISSGEGIGGVSNSGCEDPFASLEEIVALNPPSHHVKINKHRWAHPIPYIEPGCVLIANEKLGGAFHQTVVLIIDHHDKTGSTGIVLNRPFRGNLLKIASETASNVDLSLKLTFNSATVAYGGPVMQADYNILHGHCQVEGSKKVAPGVFVGGSKELMKEVRRERFNPSNAFFAKGHAAWIPHQLSREVSKGAWYVASVSPDFILRYAQPLKHEDNSNSDLWSDILTCIGGEYKMIAERFSGRGDLNRLMP